MNKKRICLITSVQFSYDKFVKNIAEQLYKENYEVTIVFKWDNNNKRPFHQNIKFYNLNFKREIIY